jgi:hypothetical protein
VTMLPTRWGYAKLCPQTNEDVMTNLENHLSSFIITAVLVVGGLALASQNASAQDDDPRNCQPPLYGQGPCCRVHFSIQGGGGYSKIIYCNEKCDEYGHNCTRS